MFASRLVPFSLATPSSKNTTVEDTTIDTTQHNNMATPGRTTRSRSRQTTPQPLPAVDVRQSHTYGSRGRANLHTQLAAAGTTFAQGFTTARATAGIAPVVEESDESEEEVQSQPPMSRQGTYVGSFAHYESPAHSERHESMPPPSPRRPAPFATDMPEAPEEPRTLSVLLLAVPRYLWRNFWAVLLGALLLGTIAHIKLPERAAEPRDQFFRGLKIAVGVPGYDQPPAKLERLWMFVRYKAFLTEELDQLAPVTDPVLQSLINVRLRGLITDIDNNQTALAERFSAIETYLPPRMVVDLVDGEMVIRDDFWHALSDKLQGSEELFDAFVAANEETATRIADTAAAGYIDGALQSKRLLDREGLIELLDQNSRDLETRLTTLVQTGTSDSMNAARTIAAQVAKEIAENTPSDIRTQLGVLAKSNLLYNTYDAMSSVNWFSPKMGAIVDPHHTSQTALKPQKATNNGWFTKSIKRLTPAPITALIPWEETGDCWCAAKTTDMGQAQLAVITEDKITPKRLIVEHIPPGGAQDIKSAPRDFELWADLYTIEEAESMKQKLRAMDSHYDLGCKNSLEPPTETSVCISAGRYDIHAENWVQSAPMLVDMEQAGLAAGKFYYRVLSNWGAQQTCTYRVRLTGHDLGEST